MSSTMQVKITLSGRAANKLLYVLKIYPANSGAEMLFLLLKALISITAPFSPTRICFGPVLALSSALSLQSSLSKSIDIERPIRKSSPEF